MNVNDNVVFNGWHINIGTRECKRAIPKEKTTRTSTERGYITVFGSSVSFFPNTLHFSLSLYLFNRTPLYTAKIDRTMCRKFARKSNDNRKP